MENTIDINISLLYDNSPLPTAFVDNKGNIIYSNTAFNALVSDNTINIIHNGTAYEKLLDINNRKFRVYATPAKDYSVVNLFAYDNSYDKYISALCATVRNAAYAVSFAADNLQSLMGNDEKISSIIKSIDGTMLSLLSEFLIPEQIKFLNDAMPDEFKPVSVSEGMREFADELSSILVKQPIGLTVSVSAGHYAVVDIKSIRLLFTDFICQIMNGEYAVDGIAVKLYRSSAFHIRAETVCSRITRCEKRYSSRCVEKFSDFSPQKELEDILKRRFGCEINITEAADICKMYMDIPIAEVAAYELNSPMKKYGSKSKLSDERIMLSRFDF